MWACWASQILLGPFYGMQMYDYSYRQRNNAFHTTPLTAFFHIPFPLCVKIMIIADGATVCCCRWVCYVCHWWWMKANSPLFYSFYRRIFWLLVSYLRSGGFTVNLADIRWYDGWTSVHPNGEEHGTLLYIYKFESLVRHFSISKCAVDSIVIQDEYVPERVTIDDAI